jgi:hypothetical protein
MGCPMVTLRADHEPFAWWERIGQDLRQRYSVPEELPPPLLRLAKLHVVVGDQLPQEAPRNWLRKLDAIEGNQLLHACKKRMESPPRLVAFTQMGGGGHANS